ncbi:unnamed protein product, partial [Brassica oleracea var. botrytis]
IPLHAPVDLFVCMGMAGGAFGGNRGLRPIPPEKGIFPLDHLHECDAEKKEYLGCLKSSSNKSEQCRHLSKKYLQCRMAKLVPFYSLSVLSTSPLKMFKVALDRSYIMRLVNYPTET